jgi:hypothetical protein
MEGSHRVTIISVEAQTSATSDKSSFHCGFQNVDGYVEYLNGND